MTAALDDLTEKEKETLRLIVRGHDAKSAANELDLSVHTINERLRTVRRKLDVTSSREAARLLFEQEAATRNNLGYEQLGDAPTADPPHPSSITNPGRIKALWIGGIVLMSAFLIAIALAVSGVQTGGPQAGDSVTAATSAQMDQYESAARGWLKHYDDGEWEAGYKAAASTVREMASEKAWTSLAKKRADYGNVLSREVVRVDIVNLSEEDFYIVLFKTDFENLKGAFERVTLESESGVAKVNAYEIS